MRKTGNVIERAIDDLMLTRKELLNAILRFQDEQLQLAHIYTVTRLMQKYRALKVNLHNYEPYKICNHCGERMSIHDKCCEMCGCVTD